MSTDLLHTLAIKGMAPSQVLATAVGEDEPGLRVELELLRTNGFATFLERRAVWRITPDGREHHASLLDSEFPAETRDRLRPAYEEFLPLNRRFKELCTRWQTRGDAPNDHTDAAYDGALVAELGELHPRAEAVTADLAGVRARFARYRDRLACALDRLRAGDTKAFTGVLCESYHDVWLELHRDLSLCLKIDRAAEEVAEEAVR